MDLGIEHKSALVCAASAGLGWACAEALAREGAEVTLVGRDARRLAHAAARIEAGTGRRVETRVADLADPPQCEALLAQVAPPDILVTNCGGPTIGGYAGRPDAEWQHALQSLLLAPVTLIGHWAPRMAERGFGRIVNITSAAVLAPKPGFALSVAPRAALMAFAATVARDVAARNVTVNNLLPHSIATDRLAGNFAHEAAERGLDVATVTRQRSAAVPAGRLGTPAEFGAYCAFLCSVQAGYVTGRNHVLDGGALGMAF